MFETKRRIITAAAVAIIAAGAAYIVQSFRTPCHGIELVWIPLLNGNDEISVDACQYFSDNYTQARDRFLRAAQLIPSAKVESILVHAEPGNEKGRINTNREQHFMDICVIPGSQPGLVIHSSGVHGVEGYAGSAIQLALMESPSLKTRQADRPTLVLVHAVNPYGMANFRRVNENNIDLNRNALSRDQFARIQDTHNSSHANYQSMDRLFNPQHAPTFVSTYATFAPRVLWHLLRRGLGHIKAAMVSGQYYNRQGIFYGGSELERSTALLERWLHKFIKTRGHHQWHSRPRYSTGSMGKMNENTPIDDAITWIDVHTGLGPSGRDTLLPGSFGRSRGALGEQSSCVKDGKKTDCVMFWSQHLVRWFPDSLRPSENSVAAGYEEAKGLYGEYFNNLLQEHSPNALFLVQEFGTIPSVLVGHALMTENAAFQFGNHSVNLGENSEALQWAKRTMLPAFYLQHSSWRRKVLQQGVRVAWQALERSRFLSWAELEDGYSEKN